MGFGTNLFTNIYYSHKTYNNKSDVETDIDANNKAIEYIKNQILQYALMTEPNKMLPEEGRNEPSQYINNEVDYLISELTQIIEETYKLNLLYDHWEECHDEETGLAIPCPSKYGSSYLDGEFINTKK